MKLRRLSLRARLALMIFASESLVLALLTVFVWRQVRDQFLASFDAQLSLNAEALATLLENDEGRLELEFADEIMTRFSRPEAPDLFAILRADGSVLEQSLSIETIPGEIRSVPTDFGHNGAAYRGVTLETGVDPEDDHAGPPVPVRVFFASSRADLDARLAHVLVILASGSAAAVLLSLLLGVWISRQGLGPLRRLARKTRELGSEDLGFRFDPASLPSDIAVLAESFNGLLERLGSAFDRERQFSADAAHELRTPVASLKAGIQAALLAPPDSARDRVTIEELLEDTLRLEHLCEALLEVSGRGAPAETRMATSAFIAEIEDCVRRLVPIAREPGTELLFRAESSSAAPGLLQAEPRAVQQILFNLVDNAIRHGGKDTTIEVSIQCAANSLRVEVADDGPGIPADCRDRVFERFFRADRARARRSGGAGLGLAISRALARAAGGDLVFEARQPHGCRFTWTVAAGPHPATQSDSSATTSPLSASNSTRQPSGRLA
ncbi:HAMP domain-containing protein [Candidatus Poribacteria bacterium]|nr:HAMP domain-containing protein [Candidatus Poribacteria bacterium]